MSDDDDVFEKMRRYCNLSADARQALLEENEELYNAFQALILPEAEKRKRVAAGFYEVYQRAKLSAEQPVMRQPMLLSFGSVGEQYDRIHELAAAHTHDASNSLISFLRVVEQFKMWREAARAAISVEQPGLSIKEIDNILNGGFRGHYSFNYLRTATAMLDLVAKYPRLLHTALTQTDLMKFGAAFKRQCGLEADFWGRLTKEDHVFGIFLATANKWSFYKSNGAVQPYAEGQIYTKNQRIVVQFICLQGGISLLSLVAPICKAFDMVRFERECTGLVVSAPNDEFTCRYGTQEWRPGPNGWIETCYWEKWWKSMSEVDMGLIRDDLPFEFYDDKWDSHFHLGSPYEESKHAIKRDEEETLDMGPKKRARKAATKK